MSDSLGETNVQSSESLLEANFSSVAETDKLYLSIIMRRLSVRWASLNVLIFSCFFPDICDSSHVAVDIESEQILVIVEAVDFLDSLDQIREIEAEGIADII